MAVAGLHNVLDFTPMSKKGDGVSRYSNEFVYKNNSSTISKDLFGIERGRVRQIFQELMKSGSKGEFERVHEWSAVIRPVRKLCGRQTLLDLLVRAQNERKRELMCLYEQRPVSEFVHRNRIQALLRGRFLRNEKPALDERPSSRAATELGLLRHRQTVSDLREGFLSKLKNSTSNPLNSAELNSSCSHRSNVGSESTFREKEIAAEIHKTSDLESGNTNTQTETDSQDMSTQELTIAIESEEVHYNTDSEVTDEIYQESDSRDALAQVERFLESVMEIESNESRDEEEGSAHAELFQNNNVEEQEDQIQGSNVDWPSHDLHEAIDMFYPPDDDDSALSLELRELYSRRRVSSLLSSGFRESLNHVLQSHVEMLARASGGRELDDGSLAEGDLEQINTTDHSIELETEWQLIDELRIDMARLRQRMDNVQNMLEACMEIQIEWQCSVLEEVSAALNRSGQLVMQLEMDGVNSYAISVPSDEVKDVCDDNQLHDESLWNHVRKGIYCHCRDSKIDSFEQVCEKDGNNEGCTSQPLSP